MKELIVGRTGDQTVKISDNKVSKRHLKLTEQADGRVLVEDLGSANGTFIAGLRVTKKTVTRDTVVQMGSEYRFVIDDMLNGKPGVSDAGQKVAGTTRGGSTSGGAVVGGSTQGGAVAGGSHVGGGGKVQKVRSIDHLEAVWARYEQADKELDAKAKRIAILGRVSPFFTLGGAAIAGVARACGWGSAVFLITSTLTILGLIVMGYSIWLNVKFDHKAEKDQLEDRMLTRDYACPECGRPFGIIKYKKLKMTYTKCPKCGCQFTVKS